LFITTIIAHLESFVKHSDLWEWLIEWADEVYQVRRVSRIVLLVELPAIEAIEEQTYGAMKCIRTT